MKWTYFIQQKFKIASLLALTMMIIILSNLVLRSNLTDIDNTSNSIYNDRLIPVRDFFYISDNIYSKRLLLEKHLASEKLTGVKELKEQLLVKNSNVDSLIAKYEKTYLVDQESLCLKTLKSRIDQNVLFETSVIASLNSGSKENARLLYEKNGKTTLQNTLVELRKLTEIQSNVGKDLTSNIHGTITSTDSISTIQIVIVILIGIFVQILIMSSKVINVRSEKFNLN